MVYSIDGKYYINISPSVFVEVDVLENGVIKPTQNKIEITGNTIVTPTTINNILNNKKIHEQPVEEVRTQLQKHNKRRR